ncbi:uncharacterized protein LOC128169152 [Crassostrea angulata]|uniref:uncharacterized protein LOC128169152 n=1 Tax=Magallana angulata TaxID=2784310 RepID=UPI0022B12865|nr:uncharacterized protein LOC128169152 [Crassostrea angulata]
MSGLKIFTILLAISLVEAKLVARGHAYCHFSICNNGTCIQTADYFRCLCPPESVGDYCQYKACNLDNVCMNSGTCQGGRCVCPEPYNGDKCEYKIYRKTWDTDNENDFHVYGQISIQTTGQENTPHHGQVGKGEGFILTLYDIAYKYLGFDYCVRFLYNIALDDKISVHPAIFDVYQRRKEIVPFQNRMVANSSAFIRDGHWHEAKFNVHGWEQADLIIYAASANTSYIAIDQVKVMRTDCANIGI